MAYTLRHHRMFQKHSVSSPTECSRSTLFPVPQNVPEALCFQCSAPPLSSVARSCAPYYQQPPVQCVQTAPRAAGLILLCCPLVGSAMYWPQGAIELTLGSHHHTLVEVLQNAHICHMETRSSHNLSRVAKEVT